MSTRGLRLPFGIDSENRRVVTAGLLLAVFGATHALTWALGGFFEPLRGRATDRLFAARSGISFLKPTYDPSVVLVVIDDASIRQREEFYVGRADHARLIRNLHRAGVAMQFHDIVFAAPESDEEDRALEQATAEAGNVYFGMGVGLSSAGPRASITPHAASADTIRDQRRAFRLEGNPADLPAPAWYFPTYPGLAAESRGLGFLDIVPDGDGIYRRAPLLAWEGGPFLASAALRVACDFLGVPPEDVIVRAGRSVTLRGARLPGDETERDIVIPVNDRAEAIVNYLGPWGEITSYPFSTVWSASDDRFMLEDLRAELEGKIAIVAFVATGAEDIGPVPTDPLFPRPAIHATLINSILTGEFLRELSSTKMMLLVELPLLILLWIGGTRLSTIPFVSAAAAAGVLYVATAAALFFWGGWILDIPTPIVILVGSTVVIASYQFHVESNVRARMDREMAVAREIQFGTFPETMPEIAGYEVAGRSVPADETGGDSFDTIVLDERRLVLFLGDATGHGIGPALSSTQVRSMLRIAMRLGANLDTTLTQVNDQLADDLASNRFVTAFLGVLDPGTGRVVYHSAGQGPLMHFRAGRGSFDWHGSTTLPMGMMEQIMEASSETLELLPGDILGLMTDGLYEYENLAGEQFGEDRVADLVRRYRDRPVAELLEALFVAVREFGRGVPQADDITMLLLRRLPEDGATEHGQG